MRTLDFQVCLCLETACVLCASFKLKDATANNSLGGWSSRLETVSTPAKIVEALSERGINCVGKTVMDADCCE